MVEADGVEIAVGGPRERTVLAVLLLERNRVVSRDLLVDALWGEAPPSTCRQQVQMCISHLRHRLSADVIETRRPGYVLRVGAAQVDVDRFEALVAAARRDGRPDEAVRQFGEALDLCRGTPLADVDGPVVRQAAAGLDEAVATVVEDRLDALLGLGRHGEVCRAVAVLVNRYPWRERLVRQQMTALWRAGRTADALAAYQRAREVFVDELGIEPSAHLRSLQREILSEEPAAPVPRQLPRPVDDLIGRRRQAVRLSDYLTRPRGVAPVAVLSGPGGAGKTALAVHVANLVADRFPDGQLYLTFGGGRRLRWTRAHVLERLLRGLGTPGAAIPDDVDDRLALYRSLIAGRRLLLVLDDAADDGDVRDLLPVTPGCAAVITSRPRLAGLIGVLHVDVDVLSPVESVELLTTLIGDRANADELARLCGGLPLALNIAAARLAAKPHWTVSGFTARLASERRRLDELTYGTLGVRPSLALSYDGLSAPARTLFRRLGLVEVDDFPAWLPGPLLDVEVDDGVDALEELVEARLVETAGDRYRLHELVRVFSRERLAADDPAADRDAALARMIGCVLHLTEKAHEREYGGNYAKIHGDAPRVVLPDAWQVRLLAEPQRWLAQERALLLAAVAQAGRAGLTELCWNLAVAAATLYDRGRYLDDWRAVTETALACAKRAGDRRGEAAMEDILAGLATFRSNPETALRHETTAERIFASIGDGLGLVLTGQGIGLALLRLGRLAEAEAKLHEVLLLPAAAEDPALGMHVRYLLAIIALDRGRVAEADVLVRAGLRVADTIRGTVPDSRVVLQLRLQSARVSQARGDVTAAAEQLRALLPTVRATGDRIGEAYVRLSLGEALALAGDPAGAQEQLTVAMDAVTRTPAPLLAGRLTLAMGRLHGTAGRRAEAERCFHRAAAVFREAGAVRLRVETLDAIATCRGDAGDRAGAEAAWRAALRLLDDASADTRADLAGPITAQLSEG